MVATAAAPAQAYAPDADRAGPDVRAQSPEWLRWLALLIFCVLNPLNAIRMHRYGRLVSSWGQDRPDLPLGSAEAEAASVRGEFGIAIARLCRRHGIGPGHPNWPELSRAIVMFGGSVAQFRPGLPACGLQWWDNPYITPGFIAGFGVPTPATPTLLEQQAVANALPPAPYAMQAEAAHARLPASWLPASWLAASGRQVFARAGPSPSTGPPRWPGLPTSIMSYARGQSVACPAVLIRAA